MGHSPRKRIIHILILLVLTGGLLRYVDLDNDEHVHKNTLRDALREIKDWKEGPDSPISTDIQKELQLDEYVNLRFANDPREVFLYIGYYHSARKAGAAHDPLVCFPGQGWKLGRHREDILTAPEAFVGPLKYASMIVEKGPNRQFLLYWFQSYDVACSDTMTQKLWLLWKKIKKAHTDNAFVRITVPITDNDIETARQTAQEFTKRLYPVFLEYVTSGKTV